MIMTEPNWQPIPGTNLEQDLNDPERGPTRMAAIRHQEDTELLHPARWWWENFRGIVIALRHDQKSNRKLLEVIDELIARNTP